MPDDDAGASLPQTEPHPAPIFDTGPHPQPLEPSQNGFDADASEQPVEQPVPAPPRSVVVPGHYHFLPRWKLALVIVAVWIPAAAIGFGLFYWWHTLTDKTPAVFVALVYVVVCTVGALMLAMAQDKPSVAALAVAVMTAVFASAAGAAPLYGHYYCQVHQQHGHRCLVGVIPY